MDAVAEIYTRSIHTNLKIYYATWLPGSPIQLGDYGTLRDLIFQRDGTITNKFGVSFRERVDRQEDEISFQTQGAVTVENRAKGTIDPITGVPLAKAHMEIKFSKGNAVFFHAAKCLVNAIEDIDNVAEALIKLYKSGSWQEKYVVVTNVVEAGATRIVVSGADGASIILEAAAGSMNMINLANSSVRLSIAREDKVGFKLVTKAGLTPLLNVWRLSLGSARFSPFEWFSRGTSNERVRTSMTLSGGLEGKISPAKDGSSEEMLVIKPQSFKAIREEKALITAPIQGNYRQGLLTFDTTSLANAIEKQKEVELETFYFGPIGSDTRTQDGEVDDHYGLSALGKSREAAIYVGSWDENTLRDRVSSLTPIPIVEEELRVGKREVEPGSVRVNTRVEEVPGSVRVNTRVEEVPVNEQVMLREETVDVHRRPVDRPTSDANVVNFQEGTFEVRERAEEAIVDKQARVVEEVHITKNVEERTENISDTVRRTDVDMDQPGTTRTVGSTDVSYTDTSYTGTIGTTGYTTSDEGIIERGASKLGNAAERAMGADLDRDDDVRRRDPRNNF